ncbi:MAG: putative ATP-dependent protease [Firmicutes bacterium]|nr:putative ATP-dependent protease [Bacillota bacterium]
MTKGDGRVNKCQELPAEKLRFTCDDELFPYESTEFVAPLDVMVGQERAVKAMKFGLGTKSFGYNIYLSGLVGTGKMTYAKASVTDIAANEDTPDDWCYVNNFENPSQPIALSLPAGLGCQFRQDMKELVEDLKSEIPKVFTGDDYDQAKNAVMKKFQENRGQVMDVFNHQAESLGILPQWTNTGFVGLPIQEGKPMSADEFQQLDKNDKDKYEKQLLAVQERAMEAIRQVQHLERETREELKKLDEKVGLFAVGHLIDEIQDKYQSYKKVVTYLDAVKRDLVKNIGDFKPSSGEEDANPFLMFRRSMQDSGKNKYEINLLINNRDMDGSPVVVETNPTYYNLIGRLEYENRMGVVSTDFTMVKAGALHRANGGYIILQVRDLLVNIGVWEALKRVLKTGKLYIENLGEQYGMLAMASVKPQYIPINIKVILIGNPQLYQLLFNYDEDFRKLFRVFADFDTQMDNNAENIGKLTGFVGSIVRREKLRHFDKSAIKKVIEYATRVSGDQNKLTTKFNEVVELLCEADAWAGYEGSTLVKAEHIKVANLEKQRRYNKYEERLQEMFAEGKLLIDTGGEQVGQVNGLAVLSVGEYMFGKPSRITANTYLGKGGVINIERETKMSGTSHSKGVLILSGYLGQKYAQSQPLTLSASLTFEQMYDGVDGDSASSTELYAILSSLAEVPIRQYLAVTGSVNQKGEIQPIGGATEKIEGFFEVCKLKGLTGKQGVVIPYQNINNLTLSDEVVDAVREGKFHIYPVQSIDQGLEILTGIPAGEPRADGEYPDGTIHALVKTKLKEYTEKLIELAKSADGEKKDD